MCMPMAISIIGGITSAVGTVMSAQAQAQAYEAQAQVARQNAEAATKQGEEELRRGSREEFKLRRDAEQFYSSQLAALAGSGSQIGGSNASVLADTKMGTEEDSDMLRYNTLMAKYSRDMDAINFTNQAHAADAAASNARSAGWWGGFTGLLNTAGNVLGMTPISSNGSQVSGGQMTVGGNNNMQRREIKGQYDYQLDGPRYHNAFDFKWRR